VQGPAAQVGGESLEDDPTHIPSLEFPGSAVHDALRLHFQSRFVPDAGVGDVHATLYRPELRGRLTVPTSSRSVVRITALGGAGRYVLRGSDPYFGDSLDVYETRISVQGAYLLNEAGGHLWQEGERWSLMGGLSGGSDFESGAFEDGLWGGVGVGLGFELPGRLQVAVGVSVETSVGSSDVDVGPVGSLRWNLTDAITLRNRGLGLQLEYHWSPKLELFASGFRETDRYALAPGFCPPGVSCPGGPRLHDLTLQDRMFLAGLGFEYRISRALRVNTEAGAIAWRRLRVHSEDLGTIASRRGDPALYLEIRFEVRP
jgi:hypothetical protein